MGSKSSKRNHENDDTVPLLPRSGSTDDVLFEDIGIVLIGGDGKNSAGNIILGQRSFTWWTKIRNEPHLKIRQKICGHSITLVKTGGSFKDLNRICLIQTQSLFKNGPHAILLVINVGSSYPEELENLFSQEVWDHTMVLFTRAENLGQKTIEDHIHEHGFTELVNNKCKKRHFTLHTKNHPDQVTDFMRILEEIIAEKEDTHFCLDDDKKMKPEEKEANSRTIKERIQKRICWIQSCVTNYTQLKNINPDGSKSYEQIIESRNNEIKRLQNIIVEKDKLIERLTYGADQTCCQHLQQNKQLKQQNKQLKKQKECLEKEVKMCRDQIEAQKNPNQTSKAGDTSHRRLGPTLPDRNHTEEACCSGGRGMTTHSSQGHHQISQNDWMKSLCIIMSNLGETEFKTLKFYFRNIARGISVVSLERADREECAELLVKHYGFKDSVIKMKDALEHIPRRDGGMKDDMMPFLQHFGETWVIQDSVKKLNHPNQ